MKKKFRKTKNKIDFGSAGDEISPAAFLFLA